MGAPGQGGDARPGDAPDLAGVRAAAAIALSAPRHSLAGPLDARDIDAYLDLEAIPGDLCRNAADQIRETFDYVQEHQGQAYLPGLDPAPRRPSSVPPLPGADPGRPVGARIQHGWPGHPAPARQPGLSNGPGVDAADLAPLPQMDGSCWWTTFWPEPPVRTPSSQKIEGQRLLLIRHPAPRPNGSRELSDGQAMSAPPGEYPMRRSAGASCVWCITTSSINLH